MERLMIDGSFGDNVDSFLSPDDVDPGDGVAHQQDAGKGLMNAVDLLFAFPTFCISI